ncbi:MAG: hypothetical protein M5R40_23740 [Anaerolineae bacterium]|nr:hypothetical protein [Anaerolineae bacterium]
MTWQDQIDSIMADNLSGATEIVNNTARALSTMCAEEPFDSQDTLLEVIQSVARRLMTTQASMAPLTNLLNRVFFAVTSAPETETALEAVIETTQAFTVELEEARREVVRKATSLIPAGVTLLTHTYSSTVATALIQAGQLGRNPHVICLEARPLLEGQRLAIELAETGIDVTFAIDAAMYDRLLNCELVLVGADSLTDKGRGQQGRHRRHRCVRADVGRAGVRPHRHDKDMARRPGVAAAQPAPDERGVGRRAAQCTGYELLLRPHTVAGHFRGGH